MPPGRPQTNQIDLATYRRAYVTPIQLALYIGVSRMTIYNQIAKGALVACKIGGVVRIRTSEAKRYAQVDTAAASRAS